MVYENVSVPTKSVGGVYCTACGALPGEHPAPQTVTVPPWVVCPAVPALVIGELPVYVSFASTSIVLPVVLAPTSALSLFAWSAGATLSVSDAELLAALWSSGLETVTLFVCEAVVEAGTVNVAVTVAVPPFASVAHVQVKLEAPLQVPPADGVTMPWVNPTGQASDTLTVVASDGPVFVVVIVYV